MSKLRSWKYFAVTMTLMLFLGMGVLVVLPALAMAQLPSPGPQLLAPNNGAIGIPVQRVSFSWSPLDQTTKYRLMLAKDEGMTQVVVQAEVTSTTYEYSGKLDYNTNYFWRVGALEPRSSDWSSTFSFQTEVARPPTTPPTDTLLLLSPPNGALGIPVQPVSFSWSPYKETTKYRLMLAKDAGMTRVVVEAEVTSTTYEYAGTLDYSTNYYWQVIVLEPELSKPAGVFSFQTEAAPPSPKVMAPPPEVPKPPEPTPLWVWGLIALGAILIIVILVLMFKTLNRS